MNAQIKSIFNLIEIFRSVRTSRSKAINAVSHCEQEQHHDFYCDMEKPFISF